MREKDSIYAIDLMASLMKEISGEKPAFFQRDDGFYATTTKGFGKLNYWLQLHGEDVQFSDGEKPYVLPLVFDGFSNLKPSLESMISIANQLQKLPDDGKIRMVSHGEDYHANKHGYGCDGTDIWLSAARVMNREKYFELIRQEEDKFREVISGEDEEEIEKTYAASGISFSSGKMASLPDVTIITPNILMTFPRNMDRFVNNPFYFNGLGRFDESPFSFYLDVNKRTLGFSNKERFEKSTSKIIMGLSKDLESLEKIMPEMQSYIGQINKIHNQGLKKRAKLVPQ